MFLSHNDIKCICQYRNDKSTVSLYICPFPNESDRDFRIRLNSIGDTIKRETEKYEGKDKDLKYFLRNFENIKTTLLKDFAEHKAQTYCVFLAKDFLKIANLPVRVKERVVVDSQFYTLPLISLLEQFERYAVLLFDRRSARLFSYYMGELKEEKSVFHNYVLPKFNASTGSWKCLREKRINHRIENSFHRHLKEISGMVFEHFKNFGFDRLLLASHKTEIEAIKRHLHTYVHMKLAGDFKADIDDNVKKIKEKLSKVIAEYRRNKEKTKISELFDGDDHRKVVFGIDAVLKALETGNVRELICADNFHTEGYTCPEGHFLTVAPTEGTKCDLCGRVLRKHAFLEDEIIEEAFAQRAEIFHLFYEKDKLDGYGIAAFLRFKLSPNQIEETDVCYPIFPWAGIEYFACH